MSRPTQPRQEAHPDASPMGRRIFMAILVLGAAAQIVQALLIREGLVVFYGNELSLGAFYGSWLFWLAVGAFAVTALRGRRWVQAPLPALRLLLLLLPLLLLVQVLALRSVRSLLGVSASELVPLGELFLSFAVVTIPSGLALGISFPLACKALADQSGRDDAGATGLVSRLYVADALGALAGGVLFTFVLVQWLGLARTLGVLTLMLAMVAWSLYPRGGRTAASWTALLVAGLGLALAVLPATSLLERQLELLRFANLQPGLTLLRSVETRYGHVAVAQLKDQASGGQISIVADGQIRESFPQPIEVTRDAAYFAAQAPGARRVLILGDVAGGLPAALLRYPVQHIDVVEPDKRAFEAVRPYLDAQTKAALRDPRLALHFADGRRFVNRLKTADRYDLILVLGASPTSAHGNRFFTREFYRQTRERMRPDGVLCTRVASAVGYLGSEIASYAGSVYHTLGSVLPHLAIVPGEEQTICASAAAGRVSDDAAELARRHRAMAPKGDDLPDGAFANLLDPREVAFVRAQLDQTPAEIDTDARPVTYYLNMLLWGRFSGSGLVDWLKTLRGMGAWPYLLPPALLVVLWLVRAGMEGTARGAGERGGAVFLLALLGIIAMAAQLTLLLGYQSHVGFVFARIALLNGVFMTGLALGAGLGTARARRGRPVVALVAVMGLVAVVLLMLPLALALLGAAAGPLQEPGYVTLALLLGLLAGTGFPLAVAISHRNRPEIVQSGGLATAADNLGGAAGGLVTGALMLPLLGSAATCGVLAMLALLATVPLLAARLLPVLPAPTPARRERAMPSFPWPGLGWALIYAVLLVYGWHLLEQGTAPGPQVHFDPSKLTELAGDMRFAAVERPFVHYLGRSPDGPAAELGPSVAALASMAAAPDVHGYGGPINLLLAVNRDGTLMGVRYLASNETPSYIAGIDTWLAGLAGADLAAGPLDLERVDGMSGATVTSRAVLATINRAAGRVGEVAFGSAKPPLQAPAAASLGAPFWATVGLLLTALIVHLTGALRARLVLLVATLGVLGLWLNTPLTEIDLVNLTLGKVATPAANPQRWLLLGFAGVTALLFGPIWCGLLCPFGALQELLSRAGRWLGLRSYPDRRVDQAARYLKYLLLAGMLIAVWLSGDTLWAAFDPMQRVFGGLGGWMLVLAAAVLLGSLFYVRFWCRYFCPLGAFLALGNKIALLGRLAPKRRFEHCDLGVRGEYDVDCIRCARCLGGEDTRLRHRRDAAPPGNRSPQPFIQGS
ncbi:MAG: FMN-binding protein [Thiohalocapsa sp.]|uniref:spermine/spermidine synthase domain-containing protein n=1 Tax=Thiohalocapsa sp. TaxID=2497641 RepID=UPI0025F6A429|nr:FMN-binding protein [Thiohalocapsa sp.]MCG6941923.1 FMN-binding protein [Thiohalocapsa sp.]